MTLTYSPSVECYEIPGTKQEQASAFNGITCSVQLMCLWEERWDLVDDIMGTPRPWPFLTTGFVPYPIDAKIREWPPESKYTTDADEQACFFEFANVEIGYSSQLVEDSVENIEPSMEAIPSNHKLFRWSADADGGLSENEAPPKILRSMIFSRTRYRLGALPTEFLTAVGCTNIAAYASPNLGITFPADTLMYMPAPATRTFYNVGAGGYTATFKFAYKPEGWNKYWNARTQSFATIYTPYGSPYIAYPQIDFSGFWI